MIYATFRVFAANNNQLNGAVYHKWSFRSLMVRYITNDRSVSHQKFAPAIFSRQATIDQVLYVFDWDFIPVFLDLDAQLLLYERTKREGLVSKDNRVDHRFKL